MTIGELAQRSGLRTSAIRYYEKLGLLEHAPRSGGQRRFRASALERLRLIRFAREAGLKLKEVQALVGPGDFAGRWQQVAARRIAAIDAEIRKLAGTRQALQQIARCQCADVRTCEKRLIQLA